MVTPGAAPPGTPGVAGVVTSLPVPPRHGEGALHALGPSPTLSSCLLGCGGGQGRGARQVPKPCVTAGVMPAAGQLLGCCSSPPLPPEPFPGDAAQRAGI